MEKLHAVLIGCGRISKNHIEAMAANKDRANFIGFCDVVEERALERQEQYEAQCPEERTRVYTDYHKMLQDLSPDIAIIATESGKHGKIGKDCLEAGCHVLIEKPLCMTLEEADVLIDLAKAKNLTLGVCHQNRFNPAVRKLRRAVEEGRFGRIHSVTARILWTRDDAYYKMAPWRGTKAEDGGTLMNQCIHNIDLLQWMMGSSVKRISAERARFMRPIEMEDFGAAVLRFENGGIGIIEGSAVVYPKNLEETLSVFGEKGTVVLGGKAVNKVQTWLFEDHRDYDDDDESETIENVYGSGHTPLYENFLQAVREGHDPLISGEEGRKSMAIVLGIYESSSIES